MKILVVGAGYVGASNAIVLASQYDVTVLDINQARVDLLNSGRMPFQDADGDALVHRLVGRATTQVEDFSVFDLVLIATPTDYDPASGQFDCSSVLSVLDRCAPGQNVVVRSTIPVGFCRSVNTACNLMFAPEFLQEGRAVRDSLYPSRFILGCSGSPSDYELARDLVSVCIGAPAPVIMSTTAAESVKLFANGYLAMRVAFFNELDSFCMAQGIDTRDVVEGVCADPRIGAGYNNPSFGYGGYCFPKDSAQLSSDCRAAFDSHLIPSIQESNKARARVVAAALQKELDRRRKGGSPAVLGVYSMRMKAGSDNTRSNATQEVLRHLTGNIVLAHRENFPTFQHFAEVSDVIIANRVEPELVGHPKLFTRDLYGFN